MIIKATPSDFIESAEIMAGLVNPGDIVLLVTPIDIEAPKGRIQMLQSHCMREILDHNASFIVTKETEMDGILSALKQPPNLVVCDSSCFGKVAATVDPAIPLTTFSILMARFKGDLAEMLKGVEAISTLVPGDKVLIAEACTHHPIGEDIGRIKIPKMLQKAAGGQLQIDVAAGREYPQDLSQYKLIIHCGACVFNRREMLSRIDKAVAAGTPITNYGLVIADHHGQVDRAIAPLEM
jgi:[FeFe] hydrogenase H-cluster maturation GTPase HydF